MLVNSAEFIGNIALASGRILTVQQCGPQALPIVALIAVLVGLILAFVGAVQLQQFGAQIYIVNMVSIGMTWRWVH